MRSLRDLELILVALIIVCVTAVALALILGADTMLKVGIMGAVTALAGALAGAARGSNPTPPDDPKK